MGMSAQEAVQLAQRHLMTGRADLALPILEALQRAMPQEQVVRQLLAQHAVISFPVEVERKYIAPAAAEPPAQADIDLVTFHVDLPAPPSGFHQQVNYGDVIRLAFEAAAARTPAARRIILTDERTPFPDNVGAHEIVRRPIDINLIMYERQRVRLDYLDQQAAGRYTVLMDADIVVNRPAEQMFATQFDVGLTWRKGFPDAPFNGGLILVRPGAPARHFLRRVKNCLDEMSAAPSVAPHYNKDIRSWWGDQFAPAAVVGYRFFGERQSDVAEIDGTRVAFLPCEDFNVTLEPAMKYSTEALKAKYCFHFKGNRKDMMRQYVESMRAGKI